VGCARRGNRDGDAAEGGEEEIGGQETVEEGISTQAMMTSSRLETFADGVFAIAATLLILNVDSEVKVSTDLTRAWPAYVAYAVSFVTIGILWVNHHVVMNQFGDVDRTFLLINVGFLMCVAFVPFPTRLVAGALRGYRFEIARAAGLTYGLTMVLIAVFFNLMWHYGIRGSRLLREDADPKTVSGITRSYRPGPWIYLVATLVALGSPKLSFILYGAIALFYVVESSIFGRVASDA
jgi:uncharacterized membrane protein